MINRKKESSQKKCAICGEKENKPNERRTERNERMDQEIKHKRSAQEKEEKRQRKKYIGTTKERKDVKINKTRGKEPEISAVLMKAHILIARKTNRVRTGGRLRESKRVVMRKEKMLFIIATTHTYGPHCFERRPSSQ